MIDSGDYPTPTTDTLEEDTETRASDTSADPNKLGDLTRQVLKVINTALPRELYRAEDVTKKQKTPITDGAVRYVQQHAKKLGIEHAMIYCTLRTVKVYRRQAERDVVKYNTYKQRQLAAEYLACELTQNLPNHLETYTDYLTKRYYANMNEIDGSLDSAIELAIDGHCTTFLSQSHVVQCVQALWDGSLLLSEDEDKADFVIYEKWNDASFWSHMDPMRLTVPRYQSAINLFSWTVFLALYTWFINNRPYYPTITEFLVYTFVFSYILDDIRQLRGSAKFQLSQVWGWINIILWTLFIAAFVFRVRALLSLDDKEKFSQLDDTAYDLLATTAIFLWCKVLSTLDGFKFFGTMIVIFENMVREGFLFFFMLAWIFFGFAQSFYALKSKDEQRNLRATASLLARGFLQDPDFDTAETYHPVLGILLFMLYVFLSTVILFNLLIALFNDSYSQISERSQPEYLTLFTYKVFRFLRSTDHYPFTPPFNLFEVFIIIPLGAITSRKTNRFLNRGGLVLFFWPFLIVIACFEIFGARLGYERPMGSITLSGHTDTDLEEQDVGGVLSEEERRKVLHSSVAEEEQDLREMLKQVLKFNEPVSQNTRTK